MTKTENRAAARAYRQELDRKHAEAEHAEAVKSDLDQLQILRKYLIFSQRVRIPNRDLIDAIDDYAGKLTGDRTALHAEHHTIG